MSIGNWIKPLLIAALAGATFSSQAVVIGNTQGSANFPQGAVSFADAVVSYAVGPGGVSVPHQGSINSIGVPNYAGVNSCASQASCTFVSLGDGGVLTVRFIDNLLTGSGNASPDLWIFEVGPDIEDTFVEISTDGVIWHSVGKVFGTTAGVDIDAFGFGVGSAFAYVRLTDDPNEGANSGATVGADIDAIGAISTVVVNQTPEPGSLLLAGLALTALSRLRRRR